MDKCHVEAQIWLIRDPERIAHFEVTQRFASLTIRQMMPKPRRRLLLAPLMRGQNNAGMIPWVCMLCLPWSQGNRTPWVRNIVPDLDIQDMRTLFWWVRWTKVRDGFGRREWARRNLNAKAYCRRGDTNMTFVSDYTRFYLFLYFYFLESCKTPLSLIHARKNPIKYVGLEN